jgi:cell division septation protein DedD
MEHFEEKNQNIKEKNVYSLHLDTPRIVLISAAIIGIIAASFLIGMNFIKKPDNRDLAKNDVIFDSNKDTDLFSEKQPLPADPGRNEVKPLDTDPVKIDPKKNDATGLITSDNFKEPVAPVADIEKIDKKKSAKNKETKKVVKKEKKSEKIKPVKNKKEKASIVEVSDADVEAKTMTGKYVIQVASYDEKFRAEQELQSLKDLNFKAHIDRKKISGKDFFRLRIGPIATKEKAIKMLNGIQENPRYGESFMVRE